MESKVNNKSSLNKKIRNDIKMYLSNEKINILKNFAFSKKYNLGKIAINYYSEIREVITLNYMKKEYVQKIINAK